MPVPASLLVASGAALGVFLMMLAELRISRANERALCARGAIEPPRDVYRLMAWIYPLAFAGMAVEGAIRATPPSDAAVLGGLVFAGAKAVKFWAMATLGERWTFRVLVLPGTPLIETGPYAYIRHPNYVGVLGELGGFALLVAAPLTGLTSVSVFAVLIARRIQVEEEALGIRSDAR